MDEISIEWVGDFPFYIIMLQVSDDNIGNQCYIGRYLDSDWIRCISVSVYILVNIDSNVSISHRSNNVLRYNYHVHAGWTFAYSPFMTRVNTPHYFIIHGASNPVRITDLIFLASTYLHFYSVHNRTAVATASNCNNIIFSNAHEPGNRFVQVLADGNFTFFTHPWSLFFRLQRLTFFWNIKQYTRRTILVHFRNYINYIYSIGMKMLSPWLKKLPTLWLILVVIQRIRVYCISTFSIYII